MSDNWADEATKTSKRQKEERMVWLIDQITGAWLNDPEGLDGSLGEKIVNALKMYGHGLWPAMDRIAELERREALLTAAMMSSVELHRLPRVVNPTVATLAVDRFERALAVLTDAGFPWKDES